MGGSLPQLGLAAGFPCNTIFKKSKTKADEGPLCLYQFTPKKTQTKPENPTNPNTSRLLIHLWAKTTQKKQKTVN